MNSLLTYLPNYVVFDLETTGFDPEQEEIIEIGAIKVQDGYIMSTFSTLVKPGKEIDPFITGLTGISNEDVKDAPSINEVLPDFFDFVGDNVVVGHNVTFDISFIAASAGRAGLTFAPDYVDTMRLARCLYPAEKHHKLQNLREWFGIDVLGAHRAMNDVLATNRAYIAMREIILARGVGEDQLLAGEEKWKELHPRRTVK